MTSLFEPLQVGALKLRNRIIMSPITRCRSGAARIPNPLMAQYYAQRATAGLIISEATAISPLSVGYPETPGLWNTAQVAGWQNVTEAVHQAGGLIVAQLWHVGRVSHPVYLDGDTPVAPSAIQAKGHVNLLRPETSYVMPRALTIAEIAAIVQDFKQATINAQKAGFDGIELHAANGYLIDQFLESSTNQRTDQYGGSLENRARFLLEVLDACSEVIGADRIGIHISPRGDSQDMGDTNPLETYTYVAEKLRERGVAFICARERVGEDSILGAIKHAFGGVVIANEGFEKASAQAQLDVGVADAVAFGKKYVANPDLVSRLQHDAPLNEPDPSKFFYLGGYEPSEGYTDYPFLDRASADAKS